MPPDGAPSIPPLPKVPRAPALPRAPAIPRLPKLPGLPKGPAVSLPTAPVAPAAPTVQLSPAAPEPAPTPSAAPAAPAAPAALMASTAPPGAVSVLDACEPIFAALLELRTEGLTLDVHRLYGALAGHLAVLRQRAAAAGLSDREADAVTFALAAFADEMVMRSDWAGRGQWPLLEYATFGTHHAGEEFFHVLEAGQGAGAGSTNGHDHGSLAGTWSGPGGAAVLEVYALCLLFGFRGRHAVSAPDEYQRELARVLAYIHSRPVEPLSPRPLSRPFGGGAGAPGEGRRWALAGALLLLAALAVVVVVARVAGG